MKKFVYAGVSAVALMAALAAVPANAADIYRRDAAPSFKDGPALLAPAWQGLYLGAHAGYSWGDVEAYVEGEPAGFDADGFIGGGQIGYNFQRGNVVFGPEIDLGYLHLEGDRYNGIHKSEGGFYGALTGRLGYSLGNTLVYAKGGAAFVNAEFTRYSDSSDDTLWGWTVGGGIEQMLRPNLSVKAEYRHFEFDGKTVDYVKFSPTADAVTLGVNVHLSRDASPLK